MKRRLSLRMAVLWAAGTLVAGPAWAAGPFEGVSVNILTFTGPQIAEPLQRRAPDFEKLTGAKINVITVPFSDLYQKMLTDMATRTNSYHAFVFAPQWLADFATPGYLEALTSRVAADKALQWQDIAPFFRNFSAVYAGRNYTVPVDGDFQMVYYRTDLLAQAGLRPPETWDDYLKIAAALDKKDLNGDGTPDFGSCIATGRPVPTGSTASITRPTPRSAGGRAASTRPRRRASRTPRTPSCPT